jgi:shikimate kinase
MADTDVSLGGSGPSYIALVVQHEPLDQIDLKDNVNATLGGGGGSF